MTAELCFTSESLLLPAQGRSKRWHKEQCPSDPKPRLTRSGAWSHERHSLRSKRCLPEPLPTGTCPNKQLHQHASACVRHVRKSSHTLSRYCWGVCVPCAVPGHICVPCVMPGCARMPVGFTVLAKKRRMRHGHGWRHSSTAGAAQNSHSIMKQRAAGWKR